jgi:hypothetical protein
LKNVGWIQLAQDMGQWPLVKAVMNKRQIPLYGVSWLVGLIGNYFLCISTARYKMVLNSLPRRYTFETLRNDYDYTYSWWVIVL